jgi:DNA mismatch endonuclease (patch repair protein)
MTARQPWSMDSSFYLSPTRAANTPRRIRWYLTGLAARLDPRRAVGRAADLQGYSSKVVALIGTLSYIRTSEMDTFSRKQRSDVMRRVRSRGTQPEIFVRSIVRRMGVRYRSCARNLPGKPDLAIVGQRKVILVHGCFWHGHHCEAGKLPKSNRPYWKNKQAKNALRDSRNASTLRSKGWKVMVIWECEIRVSNRLQARLGRFLRLKP